MWTAWPSAPFASVHHHIAFVRVDSSSASSRLRAGWLVECRARSSMFVYLLCISGHNRIQPGTMACSLAFTCPLVPIRTRLALMHVLASFLMRSSDIAAVATLVNRSAGGIGQEMSLLSSVAIGIAASMSTRIR